jgi:hypothetical protein
MDDLPRRQQQRQQQQKGTGNVMNADGRKEKKKKRDGREEILNRAWQQLPNLITNLKTRDNTITAACEILKLNKFNKRVEETRSKP